MKDQAQKLIVKILGLVISVFFSHKNLLSHQFLNIINILHQYCTACDHFIKLVNSAKSCPALFKISAAISPVSRRNVRKSWLVSYLTFDSLDIINSYNAGNSSEQYFMILAHIMFMFSNQVNQVTSICLNLKLAQIQIIIVFKL